MLKAVKEHQSINSVSLQLASVVLDGTSSHRKWCSEEALAAGTLSRLRATLHSRGQTSAFCCQYGRISQATGWLSTSQHINISINSKHMQINKWSDWLSQCTEFVFAVFHVKFGPVLRYYRKNHSRYRHYRGFFLISVPIPVGFPRKPTGLYPLPHPCNSLVQTL